MALFCNDIWYEDWCDDFDCEFDEDIDCDFDFDFTYDPLPPPNIALACLALDYVRLLIERDHIEASLERKRRLLMNL